MGIMAKRFHRSRQGATILSAKVALCLLFCISVINTSNKLLLNLEDTRRNIEKKLEETLKFDKGNGCVLPRADPFSSEATKFEKKIPYVKCSKEIDWVKCNYSNCRVVDYIKDTVKYIECNFQDIIYHNDFNYTIGSDLYLHEEESYELKNSDHIKVSCTGYSLEGKEFKWSGNTLGFRKVTPKKPPPGREHTFNVLIFAFDSTARNGFIRRMPLSWKVLTEELGATVMEGYNIVGEATVAAIMPILTGRTELELPDARKKQTNSQNLDNFPFIFYKLNKDGYRTAYFEDTPIVGTFQWRLNGWRHQPVDHYLRAFFFEVDKQKTWYCVGSTPQYKLMMDITKQFMELDGKRFVFTFIGGITHDDFNMIQTADEDMAAFLRAFKVHSEDTLLVVMGDHGPRSMKNKDRRKTLQGKFEERQPLMALRLPSALVRARPAALAALQNNARALSTPHDLHATLLDVLGMTQHWNPYRVPGADLPRALTMLEPIPRNRSCSEAGIELHWCACVDWHNVGSADPLYNASAQALLDYINKLFCDARSLCVPRTLQSIEWVRRERPNRQLLAFSGSRDGDGFTSCFDAQTRIAEDKYQIKIVMGPGHHEFEATLTYVVNEKQFLIKKEDILRSNNSAVNTCQLFGNCQMKPFLAVEWKLKKSTLNVFS